MLGFQIAFRGSGLIGRKKFIVDGGRRRRPFVALGQHNTVLLAAGRLRTERLLLRFLSAIFLIVLLFSGGYLFSAQTDRSPQVAQLYADGLAAMKANDFIGARKAFEGVLKNNPNDALAHNLLGWVLLTE